MVSLDDAVIARYEKYGMRFEILVDPNLVESWKDGNTDISLDKIAAIDEVFIDSRAGERPTSSDLDKAFQTSNFNEIAFKILSDGEIQLTSSQRKKMTESKKRQIIQHIQSNAIDPKTKTPHPLTRIEIALDQTRFSIDPFKNIDIQIKEVIKLLKPLIPLSFENSRLAFRISGKNYGSVFKILSKYKEKDDWLENGDWACIIDIPAGLKGEIISKVMSKDSEAEYKEL